jgi:glycosyl hydrolase family 67
MKIFRKGILLGVTALLSSCVAVPENSYKLSAKDQYGGNIVPQPKVMEFVKGMKAQALKPEEITVIYGQNSPKTKIGAEEINKELARKGFSGKMKVVSDLEYKKGDEKFLVIIGSPSENTVSRKLWQKVKNAKELSTLKEQGYIIERINANGKHALILAGASPQGSLYASVTFMQILGKSKNKAILPPLYIKDSPDFNWRYIAHITHIVGMSTRSYDFAGVKFPGGEKIGKEYIDWALKYKINVIGLKMRRIGDDALLPVLEYAKQRGIYTFMFYPRTSVSVGKVDKHKDDPKYKDLTHIWKRHNIYVSWSRDDLLEPLYREFAKNCKKYNVKFCWFHTVDTGLSNFNYADWKNRDALDKKRYGNNLGLAATHVINLIDKVFKKESPETQIIYVTYPYSAAVLADNFPNNIIPDISGAYAEKEKKFIKTFFDTFVKEAPKDIYTCLRETERSNVNKWLNATDRPILYYFETTHGAGDNLCSSRARYIKTGYSKKYNNIYFFPSVYVSIIHGTEVPVSMMLNAEYSWNVNQKGADYYKKYNFAYDLSKPKVVFDEIIPRSCRAYWGPEAGKYFVPLFQAGIVPGFINDPMAFQKNLKRQFVKVLELTGNMSFSEGTEVFFKNASGKMREQHKSLAEALPALNEWLDEYDAKRLDPYSYKNGTLYWLLAHFWYYQSAVWAPLLDVKEHVANGEKAKAKDAYIKAKVALKKAKAGMSEAIEKIKGKHLCLLPKLHDPFYKRLPLNKALIEEIKKLEAKVVEFEKLVEQTGKSLKISSEEEVELRSRAIIATLSEKDAPVYSSFIEHASLPPKKVLYQTEVQVYYDSKNLYVKAKMLDTKNEKPVTGRNKSDKVSFWSKGCEENDLEILLAPPNNKFFYQLACDPLGKKFSVRIFGKLFKRDSSWKCDWKVTTSVKKGLWTALATIPFSSLDAQAPQKGNAWKFCIGRQRVEKSGGSVFSTLSPGAIPNKPTTYPNIIFK